MDKREKIERARSIQQHLNRFAEFPKDHRDLMLSNAERNNPKLESADYRYLRIVVEDVDTGERVAPPLYTFRKPDEYDSMLDALIDATQWPNEILDSLRWKEFVFVGGERLNHRLSALNLRDRQLLGGRPPGKSGRAKQERLRMAKDYWDTVDEYRRLGEPILSQEDFVKARKEEGKYKHISVSTLKRALKEYQEER